MNWESVTKSIIYWLLEKTPNLHSKTIPLSLTKHLNKIDCRAVNSVVATKFLISASFKNFRINYYET